jgi:hypothetical protein
MMLGRFGLGAQGNALAAKTYTEAGRQARGVAHALKANEETKGSELAASPASKAAPLKAFTPLSELHDFAWSRSLWADAARDTFLIFGGLLATFTVLSVGLLGLADGRGLVDSLYLASITVTMVPPPKKKGEESISATSAWVDMIVTVAKQVGYGDMSPTSPLARVSFCFLIIFGLVVVGA